MSTGASSTALPVYLRMVALAFSPSGTGLSFGTYNQAGTGIVSLRLFCCCYASSRHGPYFLCMQHHACGQVDVCDFLQRTVTAWDVATGNVTWQTTPSLCWGNSLLTGSGVSNTLYSSVACAQNDDGSEHAQVFAANVSDGAVLWMFNASQPQQLFDYTVVGADGTLLVESEGVLMALG